MRIFIIGFMGSGKSTVARPVARELGLDFVDLDQLIELEEGVTIAEIFDKKGEAFFRDLESHYLRQLIERDNIVVATGGGTPCTGGNMALMNQSGTTIYLKQEPELLASRLIKARIQRPLLKGKSYDELLRYIQTTLAQREPYYNTAAITVANPTRDASLIINILKVNR